MKERMSLLIVISCLIFFIQLHAEDMKVIKAAPIPFDQQRMADKLVGKYRSENQYKADGHLIKRRFGVNGVRMEVSDDGTVKLIGPQKLTGTDEQSLKSKALELLDSLEVRQSVVKDQIQWEYHNYTNLVKLQGTKLLNGKPILQGDRIELNVMPVPGGEASCELIVRWYQSRGELMKQRNQSVQAAFKAGKMDEAKKEDIYLYEKGFYYPAVRINNKAVIKSVVE